MLWALALGAVAGCAGAPRTVTADPHDPASQDPNPEHAASPVLESLDGQFFVTCGREPVALVASGGDNPLPIGFVERPAQVRAGARRGGQVAGAISSSLGVVNAWLPVERLGWYTAEDVELTGAPVYVSAGQRVCRRDGGSSDSPRVYVETRVGDNWTTHDNPARVDTTTPGALGWLGTLARTSVSHLPSPRPAGGTSPWTHRVFADGALPVILTEPGGAPLLTSQGTPTGVYFAREGEGGAWVRVGYGPDMVGFTTAPLGPELATASGFGMGGLGLSGTGRAAQRRLAREMPHWSLRRVASGARLIVMGGQTLITPEVSYARVGPLHSMGRHTVLLGTDDGFLLVGWLLPESLVDEPSTPSTP